MLLRHGRVWREGSNWTRKHEASIRAQRLDDPAAQRTLVHYLATVNARDAEVDAIETELKSWSERPPFGEAIAGLVAYRGINYLGALTLACEVCDWRRFPTATRFMGLTGLVPTENTSAQPDRPLMTRLGDWCRVGLSCRTRAGGHVPSPALATGCAVPDAQGCRAAEVDDVGLGYEGEVIGDVAEELGLFARVGVFEPVCDPSVPR